MQDWRRERRHSFDQHVEEKCFTCHSRSTCTDKKCVCPDGYGGVKCDLRISQGARQDKIKAIRRANGGRLGQTPTESQKKQRQEAYKAFVEDIVRAKIAAGASVKDTIKENTLTIAKSDLPAQAAVVITRTPRIAAVPDNAEQDDDCYLGASATNCGGRPQRRQRQQPADHRQRGNDVGSQVVVVDDEISCPPNQNRYKHLRYAVRDPDAGDWEATEQMSEGESSSATVGLSILDRKSRMRRNTCQNDGTRQPPETPSPACAHRVDGTAVRHPQQCGLKRSTCTEAFDSRQSVLPELKRVQNYM